VLLSCRDRGLVGLWTDGVMCLRGLVRLSQPETRIGLVLGHLVDQIIH